MSLLLWKIEIVYLFTKHNKIELPSLLNKKEVERERERKKKIKQK